MVIKYSFSRNVRSFSMTLSLLCCLKNQFVYPQLIHTYDSGSNYFCYCYYCYFGEFSTQAICYCAEANEEETHYDCYWLFYYYYCHCYYCEKQHLPTYSPNTHPSSTTYSNEK